MPARITEIDINRAARGLAVLRLSDYVLVVMCGFGAVGMLPEVGRAAFNAEWSNLIVDGATTAIFVFAAYTGWRHVGVIDPRVWSSYLLVFPLLVILAVIGGLASATTLISKGAGAFEDTQSLMTVFAFLWFAAVALPGFLCVLFLRRTRLEPPGIRLRDLLTRLKEQGGTSAEHLAAARPINRRRGVLYGISGAALLLAVILTPLPSQGKQASDALRVIQQVNLLGFFLIIRARRYFQVSADSLLAVDKRPPILFLRSFADDERQRYASSERALLDFSLETRLANHFLHFGPFIAVGSPKETVPEPGAARVLLADDEWQSRVLGWMKDSNLIIMYCGTTQWVNWELRKVVENGRSTSLILMFPEIKAFRASRRQKDIAARVEQIRDVFRDTPWHEELMEFSDFTGARAMLFRADGSMLIIKSRSRSRDSYHLGALIAHRQLLDPMTVPDGVVVHVDVPAWWRTKAALVIVATVVAAVFGLVYVLSQNHHARLTFKQGELYYDAPVTQVEAMSVGDYLVRQHFFSEEKAVTVQLNHEKEPYQLRFVVNRASADDPNNALQLAVLGNEIGRDVLGGKPVEVTLIDNQLKPIKILPASAKLVFKKGELYYTDPVTANEAQAVGEALVTTGYFGDDNGASVHLGREEDTYQLKFVCNPSRVSDPEILEAFKKLTKAIATRALGGQPVVVHLCDNEFRTLTRQRVE